MKRLWILLGLSFIFLLNLKSQVLASCENVTAFNKSSNPDLGIVISSGDEETVWNALRLGIAAESKGDSVVIFVISKAVDVFLKDSTQFDISKTSIQFVSKGGNIYTCATCASMRHTDYVQMCTITSVYDLYEIVKRSKKLVCF
jgi:predicted peroxiredoxin